ncbi:ATP-binding cassette domain-containing protein [Allofranklinella schreckenbergeri]|uniref:ATP-binding cassette domain-containing protein n=1 Tax=Allofranklinella schreckenbergeri TaxID=1076744 RepID=UPI0036F47E95
MGCAEVLCLLGANGCGKTTLLRTLLGVLPPLAGQVLVEGQPARHWSHSAFACHVGYVPQAHAGLLPFKVQEVVLMGRAAHIGRFAAPACAKKPSPPAWGRLAHQRMTSNQKKIHFNTELPKYDVLFFY